MKHLLFIILISIFIISCTKESEKNGLSKNSSMEKTKESNSNNKEENPNFDENKFWEVVNLIDWSKSNEDEMIQPAVDYLTNRSDEEIFAFYNHMSKMLYDLDGVEYAKNIGDYSYRDESDNFSLDYFLYVRCYAVSKGKTYYYEALNNPKLMPKNLDFESILYIAYYAYENKHNKEFEYVSKYNFETYANKDKWQ